MPSYHWRGTRVISRRSAKHEGRPRRILFCGQPRLTSRREKFMAHRDSTEREQRGRDRISRKKLEAFEARVRLSWKRMDIPPLPRMELPYTQPL